MSDLSRLLDDLYTTAETETDTTRAPEWSSTEALDEVFASWVPGSGEDPTAQPDLTVVPAIADDTWLLDTEPEPALAAALRWSPADDDILPARAARRRWR